MVESSRQGDTLSLSTRETDASFAEDGVGSLGQLRNEFGQPGLPQGCVQSVLVDCRFCLA